MISVRGDDLRASGLKCAVPFHVKAMALFAAWLVAACAPQPPPVARIRARGVVRVVTLNSPTSFYHGAQGEEGFEFQLASLFARDMGVKLLMYPVADARAMQAELAAGRADIAAAQLTADAGWSRVGEASVPYDQIPQLIVYRKGKPRPHDTPQIESSRLAVRAGTPQERMLQRLRKTVAPKLKWISIASTSADPLEDVVAGQADFALEDAREFSFSQHLYPDTDIGFALPETRPTQWIVRRGANDLLSRVNQFFASLTRTGDIAALGRETSGDTRRFEYEESRIFHEHVVDRLPRYQPWFAEAATQTGIDWRLLAAIGYQESKWSPNASSGDGALGVMMLTPDTAAAMGITNRADPRENILAGARYFASVRAMIPQRIPEPDRTWFALAAYNVGFGHLEDARIVAQTRGLNPDSWTDVRAELPLLAEERWYTRAKRGYARGWEPVQFVDRVKSSLTLLEWQPGGSAAAAVVDPEAPGASGALK